MLVIIIEDDAHFQSCLTEAGAKLVVVVFTAKWCGPYQLNKPVYERLSKKYPQVVFLKVDVDHCEQMAATNNVSAMPTLIFFKVGVRLDRIEGAKPEELEAKIVELSASNEMSSQETNLSLSSLSINETKFKPEAKIEAYVDFTQFNKNFDEYLKRQK